MLWEAALVEPVDPSHRGELDIVDGLERAVQERASLRYCLGLEQPNCALGQRIVVRIPDAADRCRPLERRSSAPDSSPMTSPSARGQTKSRIAKRQGIGNEV